MCIMNEATILVASKRGHTRSQDRAHCMVICIMAGDLPVPAYLAIGTARLRVAPRVALPGP
jgi:hypothetical protein